MCVRNIGFIMFKIVDYCKAYRTKDIFLNFTGKVVPVCHFYDVKKGYSWEGRSAEFS